MRTLHFVTPSSGSACLGYLYFLTPGIILPWPATCPFWYAHAFSFILDECPEVELLVIWQQYYKWPHQLTLLPAMTEGAFYPAPIYILSCSHPCTSLLRYDVQIIFPHWAIFSLYLCRVTCISVCLSLICDFFDHCVLGVISREQFSNVLLSVS